MRAVAAVLAVFACLASGAAAQGFSGLARLDAAQSSVRNDADVLEVQLFLSQAVPYRVFTLIEPARLVLDFREVDFRGASPETMLNADAATGLRFGALRPGWSRMVVDLAAPMTIDEAGMRVREIDGTAQVLVRLSPATPEAFAAASGAPPDPGWDMLEGLDVTPAPGPSEPDRFVVVIDPGHGGIDPGALRDGRVEADLMLRLALELAEGIDRSGDMTAVLTRATDLFVPLDARTSIARASGADVLISLHADALEEDAALGASVYTLSDEAEDGASARMAQRHEQGDLAGGTGSFGARRHGRHDPDGPGPPRDRPRLGPPRRCARHLAARCGRGAELAAAARGTAGRAYRGGFLVGADRGRVPVECGGPRPPRHVRGPRTAGGRDRAGAATLARGRGGPRASRPAIGPLHAEVIGGAGTAARSRRSGAIAF